MWATFMSPFTSKGGYLQEVLGPRRPKVPRPHRSPQIARATLLNAFRPAQEMSDPWLFAGRREQIKQIADDLQVVGSCIFIYGDRGLGKSSLAAQASRIAMGDSSLLEQIGEVNRALP